MDCQATSHVSVSQGDFPSLTGRISPAPIDVGVSCPAKRLLPQQRQGLAIQVLAGTETVSSWPGNTRSAGSSSINRFIPPRRLSAKPSHPQVDPTTSSSTYRSPRLGRWQLLLALVLICQSSYRGVVELLRTSSIFGSPWGPCTTSCTAPLLMPGESTSVRPLQHPHWPPR